jgi:hypothetical protein
MPARFVLIFNGRQYYFNLRAPNNRIVLTSPMYASHAAAQEAITRVRASARIPGRFLRRRSSNSKPYFVVKDLAGGIVGRSELYDSAAGMERGIASVQANAPGARVVAGQPARFRIPAKARKVVSARSGLLSRIWSALRGLTI